MAKKTIAAVDVAGKRVLIRVDFNVPIENGVIDDDRRIRAALPTIKSVIDRGGKAILCSHLGRPEGKGYEADSSLAPCAKRLSEILGKPVAFPSTDCTTAGDAVAKMKNGEVILLENLRHHKGEKKGDPAFAAKLAAYADVYVNDAFGTCHRPDASMVAVAKAVNGPKVSGFLVEKEIKYLSDALGHPSKPFVVVLGGSKVSDKMAAIENLVPKSSAIVVDGAMAYTFLKAKGVDVGSSKVEADRLDDAKRAMELAAKAGCEIHLPVDHVVANEFAEKPATVKTVDGSIPAGFMGLDIGPKTQAKFGDVLRKAKTIVWNGPMGVFEFDLFRPGTDAVAKAIVDATKAGATSIVGGGDTASAVEKVGMAEKMSHVSTGGGASLEMLEGKKFESVDVLDNA